MHDKQFFTFSLAVTLTLTFDFNLLSLVTLVQCYVYTILQVSMAFPDSRKIRGMEWTDTQGARGPHNKIWNGNNWLGKKVAHTV